VAGEGEDGGITVGRLRQQSETAFVRRELARFDRREQ
jgi:hypothetical protein